MTLRKQTRNPHNNFSKLMKNMSFDFWAYLDENHVIYWRVNQLGDAYFMAEGAD